MSFYFKADRPLKNADYEKINQVFEDVDEGLHGGKDGSIPIEITNDAVALTAPTGGEGPAYYSPFTGIHLQPTFWGSWPRQQAASLFHEMTHAWADTVDKGYWRPDLQSYVDRTGVKVKLTTDALLENADNYQRFFDRYYLGGLAQKVVPVPGSILAE
jgi:hypothetical protein